MANIHQLSLPPIIISDPYSEIVIIDPSKDQSIYDADDDVGSGDADDDNDDGDDDDGDDGDDGDDDYCMFCMISSICRGPTQLNSTIALLSLIMASPNALQYRLYYIYCIITQCSVPYFASKGALKVMSVSQ